MDESRETRTTGAGGGDAPEHRPTAPGLEDEHDRIFRKLARAGLERVRSVGVLDDTVPSGGDDTNDRPPYADPL